MIDIEKVPLNYRLFYLINHNRHPLLDIFYKYFHLLGKGSFGSIVGLLSFFILGKLAFLKYSVIMLLQTAIVKLLKYTIRAKRPVSVLPYVYLLEDLRLKSFPSGDSAMATAIALYWYSHASVYIKPFIVLYPLLICYGRIYMGVHFPLDVFVGCLIGVLCFIVVSTLF